MSASIIGDSGSFPRSVGSASPARFIRLLCILFFTWLFVISMSAKLSAAGVVVWKEQPYHSDASAKALAFDHMKVTGPVTWFYYGKSSMGFEKHQAYSYIQLDDCPPELILKDKGLDYLQSHYAKLYAFAKKYPSAGTLLKPRLVRMSAVSQQFDAGSIQVDGKWIPISEYEESLRREKRAERQREEEQLIKRQAENRRSNDQKVTLMLLVAGVGLVLLVVARLLRMRRIAWGIFLALALGAGWLSYEEGGYGWARKMQNKLVELSGNIRMPWR